MATNTESCNVSGAAAARGAPRKGPSLTARPSSTLAVPAPLRAADARTQTGRAESGPEKPSDGNPGAGPLSTDAALLTLAQWFSPAFPVGAFSFSHGLDWLVSTGTLADGGDVERWIFHVMTQGNGRTDLILLAHAWRGDAPGDLDTLARALAPSAERVTETVEQGGSFTRAVNAGWGLDLPTCAYPVAVGAAARACGLPLAPTARLYLHAFAGALTSAATRAVPLGQTEAQAILRNMCPVIDRLCDEALDLPLDAIGSAAFAADIASMNHETQYSRMFRT